MGKFLNAGRENIPENQDFYRHERISCADCPVGNFCCTLKVKLSVKDRIRIFLASGLRTKRYADRLFDNSGWGIKLQKKGDCFFLKRPEGKPAYCSIYKARPEICRKFPHFYEDVKDCRDIYTKMFPRKIKNNLGFIATNNKEENVT